MSEHNREVAPAEGSLPKHLAALVGALRGPADLAENHDQYLTFPSQVDDSGTASA